MLEVSNLDVKVTRDDEAEVRLLTSLHSGRSATGLTHNFYRYPASMSPYVAREVILQYTRPGDVILDPFVGGGTSIVEAVAVGRRAIGIDLNPIATFVTSAKTTPLSSRDLQTIRQWAQSLDLTSDAARSAGEGEPRTKNLPEVTLLACARALEAVIVLPFPRQQQFARCALLRLGQWAVDCKSTFPDGRVMQTTLLAYIEEMFTSLAEFVDAAQNAGIAKNKISIQRTLLQRSTVGVEEEECLRSMSSKPRLVITSPPYPGVHVLYHRWQVYGRRESPAPFWLIDAQDGHGASYYTLGSRSPLGLSNYFNTIVAAYRSMRTIIDPDALVVQLVSFSDVTSQLPAFLEAMEHAGYEEDAPIMIERNELWRRVPQRRRWYNHIDVTRGATHELLLFHRPRAGAEIASPLPIPVAATPPCYDRAPG